MQAALATFSGMEQTQKPERQRVVAGGYRLVVECKRRLVYDDTGSTGHFDERIRKVPFSAYTQT